MFEFDEDEHGDLRAFIEGFSDKGQDKIIVDFYASWCGPCSVLSKRLEKFNDKAIIKVDIETNPESASSFKVRSVPSLVFILNGNNEVKRTTGLVEENILTEFFKD